MVYTGKKVILTEQLIPVPWKKHAKLAEAHFWWYLTESSIGYCMSTKGDFCTILTKQLRWKILRATWFGECKWRVSISYFHTTKHLCSFIRVNKLEAKSLETDPISKKCIWHYYFIQNNWRNKDNATVRYILPNRKEQRINSTRINA